MQRMMLIGPSQCGKTSLTQCLRGEALEYQKTQAIVWSAETIDTPANARKTDVCTVHCWQVPARRMSLRWYSIAMRSGHRSPRLYRTDEQTCVWRGDQIRFSGRAKIAQVTGWLEQAGAQRVFVTSAVNHSGLDELFAFLNQKESSCLTK